MLRLQNSEQVENRNAWMKVIDSMRQDAQKRDTQHDKHLSEVTEVFRGIQSNTAATLELLKQHAESDEAMAIGQSKVINQNETTHQKLNEISSDLDAILQKVESIAEGRLSDRKIIVDEIKALAENMQAQVKAIETKLDTQNATLFDAPAAPVVSVSTATVATLFTQDEMDAKKEETPHD